MGVDARGRIVVGHQPASSAPDSRIRLSVSRFDPAQVAWTTLATNMLTVGYFKLHVDAPGNIWILEANTYTRYDDKASAWTGNLVFGTGATELDYAPADAVELYRGMESLPIATDRHGNAWLVGARRKSSSDQDLPVLWINRFDASTGRWGKPATLNVTGGEDPIFVASFYPGQSEDSSMRVSMVMDAQERPVALINEWVPTGWLGSWSRAWVARGPASI